LKPLTEASILLEGLVYYGAHETPAAQILKDVWESADHSLDIHPSITLEDLDAFFALMHAVEEAVEIPFSQQDLWNAHSVFDQYHKVVMPDCPVTRRVMRLLSEAVGALDCPPY
jgi:hypothetical protein